MFSTAAKVGKVRNANLLYVVDGGELSFVHYEIIPAANGKAWVSYKVENRPGNPMFCTEMVPKKILAGMKSP